MNRKQRRAMEKKASLAEKTISQKVALFGFLPDKCDTCYESFDKKDKEMVTSWSVVIHQEAEKVRLFCPACVGKAKKVFKEKENVD
jgi:hypothetical protein